MKVILLQSRSGIDENGVDFTQNVNDIVDMPDDEAIRHIEAGFARVFDAKAPNKETR